MQSAKQNPRKPKHFTLSAYHQFYCPTCRQISKTPHWVDNKIHCKYCCPVCNTKQEVRDVSDSQPETASH